MPPSLLHPAAMRTDLPIHASLVLTAFFWGSAFNVGAHVVTALPPLTAGAERFALASVLLFAVLAWQGGLATPGLARRWPALLAVGLFGVAGFTVAMFVGLRTTSPVNAALIMGTTPLWTLLLAAALGEERLHPRRLAGLACALAGVALVVTDGREPAGLRAAPGDLVVLAGALSWALATVISRRQLAGLPPLQTTAWSSLAGTLLLLLLALVLENPGPALVRAPADAHAGVAYLAVCSSALGYLFWFNATARLGPARTATYFNLVPVATLLAALATGQPARPLQCAGILAVIAGMVLAGRQPPAPAASGFRSPLPAGNGGLRGRDRPGRQAH